MTTSDMVCGAVFCLIVGAGLAVIGTPIILVYMGLERLFGA